MADSRADNTGLKPNGGIRSGIRRLARQDNAFGRLCSFLLISFRESPALAYQKVTLPARARKKVKAFATSLDQPRASADSPYEQIDPTIKISVLVPLYNTPLDILREMIASVQAQTYPNWELCLADGSDEAHASVGEECRKLAAEDHRILYKKLAENRGISENSNACIDMASGDYMALLDHDDLLQPDALMESAKAIVDRGADFVYSDEFVFASPDKTEVISPHFKPDYSPESLLSNNYICHLSVFRASLLEKAGRFQKEFDGSQDHDLILRLTDSAEKVVHIPKVLYFWRSHPTSVASDISTKTYAIEAGRNAVRDFLLTRRNIRTTVESAPEFPTLYHVRYPVEGEPPVNIILDCRDLTPGRIVEQITKVHEQTEYKNYTVTAIIPQKAQVTVPACPVTWIRSDAAFRPERFSRAISGTAGDFVVLLDPELDLLSRDWLTEMLMLARQKEIGAVGARIFFRNSTLRHGGLILGLGSRRLVGRSHFGAAPDISGAFGQTCIVSNVSAVSAECMMFRRSLFDEVQGFNPGYLDTLFDVDFCLRLLEKGYRNLYTPFAKLRGGSKRKYSLNFGTEFREYPHDAKLFSTLWHERIIQPDPFYNSNLTLDLPDWSVR